MDHAENPGLLSSAFHNIPLVKDPAKSVIPNDHLGDELSNMIANHEHEEKKEFDHDHFNSVINHHPHSIIKEEMNRLIEHEERNDYGPPQMKSSMKN